jgi:hypothetical protein
MNIKESIDNQLDKLVEILHGIKHLIGFVASDYKEWDEEIIVLSERIIRCNPGIFTDGKQLIDIINFSQSSDQVLLKEEVDKLKKDFKDICERIKMVEGLSGVMSY